MPTGTILESELRQAQRAELDAVLAAESFRRAPTLARILEYLCERQMAGETFIKEYEIAVQVMGRSSHFDPQQDGSVRVNLHHLRKKLKRYYETEGAGHTLAITLPIGQSLPTFLHREVTEAEVAGSSEPEQDAHEVEEIAPVLSQEATEPLRSTDPIEPAPSIRPHKPLSRAIALVAALVLLATAAVSWIFLHGRSATAESPLFVDAVVRIGCGQARDYRDHAGRVWGRDVDFRGGTAFSRKESISGTTSESLFLQGREGNFEYSIPVPDGKYELHLYFAETALHGEGFRIMQISVNDQQVEERFDPTSDSGLFGAATEKVYLGVQPASDGKVHLRFQGVSADAFVNAIELMPSNGDRMRPVRQTTLAQYYFDPQGIVWTPDEWFHGGRTINLLEAFPRLPLDGFYQHERFGNFEYSIPVVPNRRYSLTLYFQDVWFSQAPQKTQPFERREFNVTCNGKELLHQQNILGEAGGSNFRLTKHFTGLTPSPQGKLTLQFRPIQNYATVNAIEVVEEEPAAQNAPARQP